MPRSKTNRGGSANQEKKQISQFNGKNTDRDERQNISSTNKSSNENRSLASLAGERTRTIRNLDDFDCYDFAE